MSNLIQKKPLILASSSKNRAEQLQKIGLTFEITPPNCDEAVLKRQFQGKSIESLAALLAQKKALSIQAPDSSAFILSADQICALDDIYFDKPITHDNAIYQLQSLQGKTHRLITSLCLAHRQEIVWSHTEVTYLTMHPLNQPTIENYLVLDKPYQSCGSYRYESYGQWLFQKIEGLESNIVGLPIPVLVNTFISHGIIDDCLFQRQSPSCHTVSFNPNGGSVSC